MVEGETERAFQQILRRFLDTRLHRGVLTLKFTTFHGALPTGEKLKRIVTIHLTGAKAYDHVIWLSDVYPGGRHWKTAAEAKARAREWVGEEPKFHPHVALHDFEAWLLPYWDRIKAHSGSNRREPAANPESVNHSRPPASLLAETYRTGSKGKAYKKPIDAQAILKDQDLLIAINKCPELKAFVNTLLRLAGGIQID